MAEDAKTPDVRMAELLAALSLGIDLGFGQPMEHVLRQCLIALRLGEMIGLDQDERAIVYYAALLVNVGCHSDAHEQAKWFGDDIALKANKYEHRLHGARAAVASLRLVGSGNPPLHRFRVGLDFLLSGHREVNDMIAQHSRIARSFADELELPTAVSEAVGSSYEQWDGRGWPGEQKSDQIPMAARITQLAEFVEVAHRIGGIGAAETLARQRSGSQFDPKISALFCTQAGDVLGDLDASSTWKSVIDAEPSLAVTLSPEQFDTALLAIATFIDLKSPYTLGHARAVAELASTAGEVMGLSGKETTALRQAGLVHGFGRLGVSNSIWDKPGPLGAGEWERVRLQPYLTERMLSQSPALAPLCAVAVQYRERLDGSGYPRGLSGGAISLPARILGAADSYQSMREARPHRGALSAEKATGELRDEVRAGRLDGDAVDAVLRAAGRSVPRRQQGPAGLTAREVEVLRLLARGSSNKDIAKQLVITPKTASNHVEHIYTKVGASTRAGAALYAVRHGLLPE